MIDILEINRLRRQLLFQSYVWDHRLVHAASVNINSPRDDINDMILENMVTPNETLVNVKSPVDLDASENLDMKQFQQPGTDKSIGTGSPTCLEKILGIYQVCSSFVRFGFGSHKSYNLNCIGCLYFVIG